MSHNLQDIIENNNGLMVRAADVIPNSETCPHRWRICPECMPQLTIRDNLAISAPIPLPDRSDFNGPWHRRFEINAEARYAWADAMMAASGRGK